MDNAIIIGGTQIAQVACISEVIVSVHRNRRSNLVRSDASEAGINPCGEEHFRFGVRPESVFFGVQILPYDVGIRASDVDAVVNDCVAVWFRYVVDKEEAKSSGRTIHVFHFGPVVPRFLLVVRTASEFVATDVYCVVCVDVIVIAEQWDDCVLHENSGKVNCIVRCGMIEVYETRAFRVLCDTFRVFAYHVQGTFCSDG